MSQLFSCYEDKGNYDYRDINEVKISGLPKEKNFAIRLSDTLKIPIDIVSTLGGNESDYEYKWTAVIVDGMINGVKSFDIGTKKDLKYFVELPQQEYFIYCNILDKKTGVTWRDRCELKVITATSDGWVILSDQNGESRIDMVSVMGEKELYVRNILKDCEMPNKKSPDKLVYAVDYVSSTDELISRILLLTKTGTSYLNLDDVTWSPELDYKYEMGSIPSNFTPTNIACWSEFYYARNLLITETEMYGRNTAGTNAVYGFPINFVSGEDRPFKASPYIITDGRNERLQWEPPVIVYDTDNKRFIQVQSDFRSCKVPTVKVPVFSMNTGKDILFAANTAQHKLASYALLKGDDNKVWLYGFGKLEQHAFTHLTDYYYEINSPGIETATLFAIHPYLTYLYYVANNILYQFDMVTKNSKIIPTPSGEKITFIKFFLYRYGSYGVNNNPAYKLRERVLIVGSQKELATELNGVVRMYEIPERMEVEPKLYREYDGFAKPIDIIYREK